MGACPICGKGKLFEGYLKVASECRVCGQDFTKADPGDGPAVFAMFFVSLFAVIGMVALELSIDPPIWVQILVWGTLILIMTLGILRLIKALLVGLQFRLDARPTDFSG